VGPAGESPEEDGWSGGAEHFPEPQCVRSGCLVPRRGLSELLLASRQELCADEALRAVPRISSGSLRSARVEARSAQARNLSVSRPSERLKSENFSACPISRTHFAEKTSGSGLR